MLPCEELKGEEGLSNTLDHFAEVEQVMQMIDTLKSTQSQEFEREFEQFTEILTRYQEQPHLMDPHLEMMLQKLLNKIRDPALAEHEMHAAFKYMYIICKVRTYKVLVKFLPHELSDLEFALKLLEKQNPAEFKNWETRYILLLWMSILVLNPFHMARLDAYVTEVSAQLPCLANSPQMKTKMQRIFELCKTYGKTNDTCSQIAAYLSAKFLVRADIKELYLEPYFDWVISQNRADTVEVRFGQLAAVAAILKHGKREDLLPYADKLLQWIIGSEYKKSSDFLKYKYYIKIIQRIGLIYLKPRVAGWRYKRGTRSLALNLSQPSTIENTNALNSNDNIADNADSEENAVPDAIEDVIEELMQGLRSGGNDIRWSAAKGLGRVANRLSKEMADEVIGSVIEILTPLEPHEAWHGGCLALAELAKRGILLPHRFSEIVPLLTEALFYDEMKGYMSVGQHIRDSACYMCWAFARAYKPEDLQPFVQQISTGLLTVAAFDREINCRRAASAAFQESVGRLGNFPHGIEISTTTDFYSVGLRKNTFLIISDFIAQFEEYQRPLIDHLVERKVNHWDISIRELAAKALYKLTLRSPVHAANVVMAKLFAKTDSIDINTRHGSVLALGEVTLALRTLEMTQKGQTLLSNQSICDLNEIVGKFLKRELFRGMSGEYMKLSCTDFIRNCSLAKIDATAECLEYWQHVIDHSLQHKTDSVRESATSALAELCKAYYDTSDRSAENEEIIRSYLKGAEKDLEEHVRMGYVSALGALPIFMIRPYMDEILDSLVKHSLTPLQAVIAGEVLCENRENIITYQWSEARRESVKALSNLIQTVGFQEDVNPSMANPKYLNRVVDCLLKAMGEYTLDNRGDIGAWVREAAMTAAYQILITCPKHLLSPEHVQKVLLHFVQQSVEKIDRTRGLAARLLCSLVHADPAIPHISQHNRLKDVFPTNFDAVLWLFADHTFPILCSLLEFPEYSKHVLLGLSASIGQLTESLIKYSSAAFFNFLRAQPETAPRLCKEIVSNFEDNLLNERVTYPMLNFLDILISSGTINSVLLDEANQFADDVFRLVSLEIKGYKKLYKLISSINVYCQLIQVPRMCKKILTKMAIFLGLTHVHVRKTTATKLYEALALYGDACADIPEENIEDILSLLSETDWGMPLLEVRPIRNNLCVLLGIQPPQSGLAAPVAASRI